MRKINYKKKQVVSKAICLGLGAAMALGLAGCGKGNAEEASAGASVITAENQQKALEEILDGQVTASHSSTAGKEETVYVMGGRLGQDGPCDCQQLAEKRIRGRESCRRLGSYGHRERERL